MSHYKQLLNQQQTFAGQEYDTLTHQEWMFQRHDQCDPCIIFAFDWKRVKSRSLIVHKNAVIKHIPWNCEAVPQKRLPCVPSAPICMFVSVGVVYLPHPPGSAHLPPTSMFFFLPSAPISSSWCLSAISPVYNHDIQWAVTFKHLFPLVCRLEYSCVVANCMFRCGVVQLHFLSGDSVATLNFMPWCQFLH